LDPIHVFGIASRTHRVVSGTPDEEIAAQSADERVVTVPAVEGVVPTEAVQAIRPTGALEHLSLGPSFDHPLRCGGRVVGPSNDRACEDQTDADHEQPDRQPQRLESPLLAAEPTVAKRGSHAFAGHRSICELVLSIASFAGIFAM
jgi:hypothetical protein